MQEEEVGLEKTIAGEWTLSNTNYFGINAPGDGSSLSFNECDNSICTGVDYKDSDQTSSTFTYVLNGEESIDIVDDDTSEGDVIGTEPGPLIPLLLPTGY